ncbi:hypothetical protein FPZ12_006875 [Amycolatopsis acidicola]|uniref:DUF6879 domain-containing protein n=1 Tax=Amycolatopsis acidicola TaxID=2596893 RepID=A0A5N0VH35_9PSEU|nr:DUF6879 family protein [Amycolatopsis acidicola]KAA9164968.1 hypothetical protein FPZ12_006875 [Amycolatopsis acidicola]
MAVSNETAAALFSDFERSAFRLETLQTYTIPRDQPSYERFLAGEPKPAEYNASWETTVRQHVAAGKTMQRVKVVRRPFTDYTRYMFAWALPGNVAAGEDYLILDLTDRRVDLPDQDFWLFDDTTVLLLHYNADGTLRDRDLADQADVDQYRRWRDLALAEAVPFGEYRDRA